MELIEVERKIIKIKSEQLGKGVTNDNQNALMVLVGYKTRVKSGYNEQFHKDLIKHGDLSYLKGYESAGNFKAKYVINGNELIFIRRKHRYFIQIRTKEQIESEIKELGNSKIWESLEKIKLNGKEYFVYKSELKKIKEK